MEKTNAMNENEALTDLKNIRNNMEECWKLIVRSDPKNYKKHIEVLEETISENIEFYRKRGLLNSRIEQEFSIFLKDKRYLYERLWRI